MPLSFMTGTWELNSLSQRSDPLPRVAGNQHADSRDTGHRMRSV